jgi:ABC-type lipoprotein export system ATPase subunit
MAVQQQIAVSVRNVSQDFGIGEDAVRVLSDVNFELLSSSFNIIYGPSGSGKSTLLNILTGLQQPTTGSVSYAGKEIYKMEHDELARFRAYPIGIVYQQNYWVHSLSVVDNVAMPLYFLGYPRALARELALISLERVGMQTYGNKQPAMLSGGEQQRIAVARALVNDPLFIIADEPTGSLDSKNGDMVMDLLKKAHSEQRRMVILVTHNMEYLPLADHLLHIEDGKVRDLKGATIKATTNALLEDMKQRIERLAKAQGSQGGAA